MEPLPDASSKKQGLNHGLLLRLGWPFYGKDIADYGKSGNEITGGRHCLDATVAEIARGARIESNVSGQIADGRNLARYVTVNSEVIGRWR